jgi:hypothetical protein
MARERTNFGFDVFCGAIAAIGETLIVLHFVFNNLK